jgi:hypothetical protein
MMSLGSDGRPDREDQVSGQDFESEQQGGGGAAVTNVVPLPRPWYGSPAELVPIGMEPAERDEPPAVLAHATDFWGGGRSTLERVVGSAPVEPGAGQPSASPDTGPEREHHGERQPAAGAAASAGYVEAWIEPAADPGLGARAAAASLFARAASSGRLRRLEMVAFAVVAMAAGTAAAIVLGAGLAPSRSNRGGAAHTRPLTVTQTIPVRELVVRTVTRGIAQRPTRPAREQTSSRRLRAAHRGTREGLAVRSHSAVVPAASGAGERTATVTVTHPAPSRQPESVTAPVSAANRVAPSDRVSGCAPSVTNGGACSL